MALSRVPTAEKAGAYVQSPPLDRSLPILALLGLLLEMPLLPLRGGGHTLPSPAWAPAPTSLQWTLGSHVPRSIRPFARQPQLTGPGVGYSGARSPGRAQGMETLNCTPGFSFSFSHSCGQSAQVRKRKGQPSSRAQPPSWEQPGSLPGPFLVLGPAGPLDPPRSMPTVSPKLCPRAPSALSLG